jgi:gas vesicle protein
MDETNENAESAAAVEEVTEETVQAAEEGCSCGPGCRCGKCRGLCGGILSGAIVGAALALLLSPMRGERGQSRMLEGGPEEERGNTEEEGRVPVQVAVERAQGILGGIVPAAKSAWTAVRERLREALEEGKEGMAEGQEEARHRYEFMTRRRRPRR